MSDMRTTWRGVKKDIAGKKDKETDKLLKTFTKGLGKELDKVAEAYKKKDDAKTKEYALKASKIAKQYCSTYISVKNTLPSAVQKELTYLKIMADQLTEVSTKGLAAGDVV
jgi:hypothetical protein